MMRGAHKAPPVATVVMPRPVLTRSRIVSAGVSVVGELGLSALDLRTVARRVNSTATGVQRLVGATELVDAVVAQIVTAMPKVPTRGDRAKRIRMWAHQTRAWLIGYPGLAGHLLANRWDPTDALDRLEEVVTLLDGTDLRPGQALSTGVTLYWFVLGSADLDTAARVIGGDAGVLMDAPSDRWPRLAPVMGDYSAASTASQFSFGVDLLLEGIDRRVDDVVIRAKPRPPHRPPTRRTAERVRVVGT